jgi:hypothetical protein
MKFSILDAVSGKNLCSVHVGYDANGTETETFATAQVHCMRYSGAQIPGTRLPGQLKFVW